VLISVSGGQLNPEYREAIGKLRDCNEENITVRCTSKTTTIIVGYQYYATLWLGFRFSIIPFFHHSNIPLFIIIPIIVYSGSQMTL
jgi:hypothetical protein